MSDDDSMASSVSSVGSNDLVEDARTVRQAEAIGQDLLFVRKRVSRAFRSAMADGQWRPSFRVVGLSKTLASPKELKRSRQCGLAAVVLRPVTGTKLRTLFKALYPQAVPELPSSGPRKGRGRLDSSGHRRD